MNNMQVAATVILYNPEDDVYNNISSYGKEVATLIVVDNSTIHNLELIEKIQNSFENLIYINNNANVGIATALNIGCDKAIELGYEWILTMDQDSKFINFSDYKKCLSQLKNPQNVAILSANTNYNETMTPPETAECTHEEKFSAITSANFLNLSLFGKIGKFEDKLFIDLVDYDYSIKAQINNFKVLYYPKIFVQHSLGAVFIRKNLITRKERSKVEHNPQRTYYFARNFLYVAKQFGKRFPKEMGMLKILNILFIHEVTKIILYEDQKLKKLYAKFMGLTHFIFGKYGKYDI